MGRSLLRFRRLNGIKQAHVAELLCVSQGSISRWEGGTHAPDEHHREKIATLIAAHANNNGDMAMKRLISTSTLAVHLVCDATHILLAASPARAAVFAGGVDRYLGTSLWRYASPEIAEAEARLADDGWFERPFKALTFRTGDNLSHDVPVRSSTVRCETIPLADGRVGRVTTTLAQHA
ncbi:XRE family transcriptional regulator [Sphingomonas crocodyli]|uniref:XRE family transcriptional regulator n=1 Tax=Sphingomonas crocodyli TaxID=1979270 RepID=A0A437LYZ7_9SPHN|nr:XRE family transcriptional regulator [Sphingomonas crocodyli]